VPELRFTRAIVCGSRNGAGSFNVVRRALDAFDHDHGQLEHVIVGSRKGVDRDAFEWAMERERMATIVPARWTTGGARRGEGPLRNRRMTEKFSVHVVLAFPGAEGTEDMKSVARAEHIPLWVCVVHGANRGARFDWMREGV
jgi:hypothetical protein